VLVVSQAEVKRLLDLPQLLDALRRAFIELSAGRASVPPRIAAFVPDRGLLGAMPGYSDGVLETKLVSVFAGNHDRGLPSHQAVIALFDAETGTPLALLDGTHITAARTGAAAAVSTDLLARAGAGVLAVLGAGVQGRSHLEAHRLIRNFSEVRVASRDRAHAEQLAGDFEARVADTFEAAVRGADVVCCCTDAAEPILRREWLSPGVHVTSVGSNVKGGELDRETVRAGLLTVESRAGFLPPPAGSAELQGLDPESAVELGELLAGTRPGRTSSEQVTVYKSMGHAVEDAAAAGLVYRTALALGAGTQVQL